MPPCLIGVSPYAGAAALGVAISLFVVNKVPEHAGKVRAGAWVVAGWLPGSRHSVETRSHRRGTKGLSGLLS